MKNQFFPALCLILVVTLSPQVLAGGEITNPAPATLRVSLDDQIRNVANESMIVYDEETNTTPIQIWESDDEVGIEIYAQNLKFHRITITEAIDNARRPVYLCYNNYMINYAYNQVNVSFCDNYNYGTMLREIRVGQSINFEIPPIINGSNAWSVWVGNGAGGGGGIPVCENLDIGVTKVRNPLTTQGGVLNVSDYGQYSWTTSYIGSTYVGCTVSSFAFQDYSETRPIYWRNFVSGVTNKYWYNETNSTTQGLFSSCSGSASIGSSGNCLFSNFHYNNTCLQQRTLRLRGCVTGTVSGSPVTVCTTQKLYDVNNSKYLGDSVCFPKENVVLPPENKEDFNPLFLFFFPAAIIMILGVKKTEKKPPQQND